MHVARAALAAVALAGGAGGCGGGSEIDPFPIGIDLSAGAALASAGEGETGTPEVALVDTLSPISVIDDFVAGQEDGSPRQREIELRLYATSGAPRAAFSGVNAFDLHPCARDDGPCEIGVDASRRALRIIVGADVLSRVAVRFDLPASALTFFPDIAGDENDRAKACDAVFPRALAGGGTLRLGDSEIDFGAHRLAVGACLNYDAEAPAPAVRGSDALMVVATGIPMSILGSGAWTRYRAAVGDDAVAPPLETLPMVTVHLSSGPITGRLGTITRMAILGEGPSASEQRGPCMELYAHHLMSRNACLADDPSDPCELCGEAEPAAGPCPCDNKTFCLVSAGIEIDRSFPVAIVDDLEPLLQSLRDELRPALAEVDGLLAPGALAPLVMDIDYPNGRLVARCGDDAGCLTRPQISGRGEAVADVAACLGL